MVCMHDWFHVCFIMSNLVLSDTLVFYLFCQWMVSGSRGLCGRAVLKPVEGGASRETGFVMGPFLEGSLVLENEKRSGAVTKKDAQVSGWEHRLLCQQHFIRDGNLSYLEMFLTNFTSSLSSFMKLIYSPFVNRTS